MDDRLRQALACDYVEDIFRNVPVRIRMMSLNERLELVDRYDEAVTSREQAELFVELVSRCVDGVSEADAQGLRESSFPRLQELSELVMAANGMAEKQAETIAGN